ncbi:hypothetical protein [Streptomyces sp. NPDC057686]|uniref:hypothetical protein n=1 Tax=Streptomyces sp. NPDC057686 TaxID=3346212 RepID=UPI0036B6DC27
MAYVAYVLDTRPTGVVVEAPDRLPVINQDLFRQVYEQICRVPESHCQSTWEDGHGSCGTARCVGGWALYFTDPHATFEETARNLGFAADGWCEAAAKVLGLTMEEADYLFYVTGDEEAVRLVEGYALRGRAL